MTRPLLVPLVALMSLSCGGEDETLAPAVGTTAQAVTMEVQTELPMPDEAQLAQWLTEQALKAREVKQGPVEERFFYTVDVNVPSPSAPTPPCPSCR